MKNERMKYMRRVIGLISLLLALSLSATAQIFGATQQEEQQAFGASAPSAAFQSTSTMSGSGSTYSANPELNTDGTATYEGASNAPAKSIRRPGGVRKDDWENPLLQPLGDAVLPLLFMSLAFVGYKASRRKRSAA
jgi:ABC-type transport system substrate-binding protein